MLDTEVFGRFHDVRYASVLPWLGNSAGDLPSLFNSL